MTVKIESDDYGLLETGSSTPTVPTTRVVTAGAGLTGGGDLSADRTFDVVANADGSIVVAANDVKVGILATDAQHGVRGGGTQHANAVASGASGFLTGADKASLDTLVAAGAPDYNHFLSTGVVTVTASPHTPASTTRVLNVDTVTVAATINLPAPSGRMFLYIKDSTGNAGTNNITLARNGSELIEGVAANKVLSAAWGFWFVYTDGTNWFIGS